jgi:hypothetical protein
LIIFRLYLLLTYSGLVTTILAKKPPSEVIPLRSPIPSTLVSTWVAPPSRAQNALAIAQPVSLWKCVSMSQLTTPLSVRTSYESIISLPFLHVAATEEVLDIEANETPSDFWEMSKAELQIDYIHRKLVLGKHSQQYQQYRLC